MFIFSSFLCVCLKFPFLHDDSTREEFQMTQITHRKNKLYGDILAADVSSQHVHYFLQCVQQKWKNSAIKNLCRYLNKWLYTRLVNSLFPMLNIINNMNIQKRIAGIFFIFFFDNCWFFNVEFSVVRIY